MSGRHLLLQGDFLHASLYSGHLTVVSYGGEILRFDLPWLDSESLTRATAVPDTEIPDSPEATPLPVGIVHELQAPSAAEVLTLHDYDGVTYLGGEDGLWALAERWHPRSYGASGFSLVIDRPTLDLDTTFGVGAVAHGDGLSVLPLSASWLADEYFTPSEDALDSPAFAVTWTRHDLLSRTAPLLFEVTPARFELRSREHRDHYVFQGLNGGSQREVRDSGVPISAIAPRSYATWDGSSDSASLFRKKRYGWRTERPDDDLSLNSPSDFHLVGEVEGRVISLSELGGTLICEMSDRLSAVDSSRNEIVLLDHAATDVRVYPRSRRYRGIVTAVSEYGVHILDLG